VHIHYTNTTYTTATLEWTVPYIAYTPETYYLKYGSTLTSISQFSHIVTGSTDLKSTNRVYSLQLAGLLHNITYYYQLVAQNTYASTQSSVLSFVTIPLRK